MEQCIYKQVINSFNFQFPNGFSRYVMLNQFSVCDVQPFNSLTDSHLVKAYSHILEQHYHFQFPNGFSPETAKALTKFTILTFQFPNGFSRRK